MTHPRKHVGLFAFLLAGLAACDSSDSMLPTQPDVATPSFAVVFNERIAVAETQVNNCPPAEALALSGVAHVVIQDRADGTFRAHINWSNVKGVGLVSGATYSAQNNLSQEFDFGPPFEILESRQRFQLIRHGGGDDRHVTTVLNPVSGTFVAEEECRG
jgi:hypothetical protein